VGAAATVAIIFMISFAVIRVASVAMRLTGLPEDIARFQCLSAFTGTGFTTSESELVANYPLRRRILGVLMVVGNLGLVSIAATLILSLVDTDREMAAMGYQVALIVLTAVVVVALMSWGVVDRAMCGLIGTLLEKTTSLGKVRHHRLLQVAAGYSVAAHQYPGGEPRPLGALEEGLGGLRVLAVRGRHLVPEEGLELGSIIRPRDTLICYGADDEHERFAEALASVAAPSASPVETA